MKIFAAVKRNRNPRKYFFKSNTNIIISTQVYYASTSLNINQSKVLKSKFKDHHKVTKIKEPLKIL